MCGAGWRAGARGVDAGRRARRRDAVFADKLSMGIWLVLPVFFSPHGIFILGQNAFAAILQSLRMIRFTLPTSGLFLLGSLLISEGLGYLWRIPPNDSWLTLVAISGHAFISTGLLAASFIYYRDINVWLQVVFEQLKTKQATV